MNPHVHRFYRKFADEQAPTHLFHEVIGLHEGSRLSWEEVSKKAPSLPKGWYELSHLKPFDRVDFACDFWLSALPFSPHAHASIQKFFDRLDDVGVYLTQVRFDSPFECEMVYSLEDGSCFYRGFPPCQEEDILQLNMQFQDVLPKDYLSFLRIHDGFSKHSEIGILRTFYLGEVTEMLREEIEQSMQKILASGQPVDPTDLIPFYESVGSGGYQCFFAGWTPMGEAGNVYYSSVENTLSDVRDRTAWQENFAFPTFLDWLTFYLESIE